jgi:hypothetical protein
VTALQHARSTVLAVGADVAERIEWVEGDLGSWTPPPRRFDLVVCLYVHVAGSARDLVTRLGHGVASGGTLFLVGHLPVDPATGEPTPAEGQTQVTFQDAIDVLDPHEWQIVVASRGLSPSRTCFVELRYVLERLIRMRVGGVLTIVLAVPLLAGCGEQGPGTTRDQSGLAGRVSLGPQCPVATKNDPCADAPAAGSRVTVAKQLPGDSYAGGEVVARTTTDSDGSYRVAVAPGDYVVTADAGMSCELMDARVTAGVYSKVDIPCDTGIR